MTVFTAIEEFSTDTLAEVLTPVLNQVHQKFAKEYKLSSPEVPGYLCVLKFFTLKASLATVIVLFRLLKILFYIHICMKDIIIIYMYILRRVTRSGYDCVHVLNIKSALQIIISYMFYNYFSFTLFGGSIFDL